MEQRLQDNALLNEARITRKMCYGKNNNIHKENIIIIVRHTKSNLHKQKMNEKQVVTYSRHVILVSFIKQFKLESESYFEADTVFKIINELRMRYPLASTLQGATFVGHRPPLRPYSSLIFDSPSVLRTKNGSVHKKSTL